MLTPTISRRDRVAPAVLVTLFIAAPVLLFFWWVLDVPLRLQLSRGAPSTVVVSRIGPPLAQWPARKVECWRNYPCDKQKARGQVLFWMRAGVGFYAYFDEHDLLVDFETNSS